MAALGRSKARTWRGRQGCEYPAPRRGAARRFVDDLPRQLIRIAGAFLCHARECRIRARAGNA